MHRSAALIILSFSASLSLSGCGGGGGSSGPAPTLSPPTAVKIYLDGTTVLSSVRDTGSGSAPEYGFAYSILTGVAEELVTGQTNLTVTGYVDPSTWDGFEPEVIRSGSVNGTAIATRTYVHNLNASGSEYAGLVFVDRRANDRDGLAAIGSVPSSLPTGSFTYEGWTQFQSNTGNAAGNFTMTADFNNRSAVLETNMPFYFFNANDIEIDMSTGTFTSSNAQIGTTGVNSSSATVRGSFAGTAASGVSGIVYPNGTFSPQQIGAFVGTR